MHNKTTEMISARSESCAINRYYTAVRQTPYMVLYTPSHSVMQTKADLRWPPAAVHFTIEGIFVTMSRPC